MIGSTCFGHYYAHHQELTTIMLISGVPRGSLGVNPPQIPKALQNRAKLNPIVKTVKNFWI